MSTPRQQVQTYLWEKVKEIQSINRSKDEERGNQAQIYECSCGKQYKSFPAIYLHFRTKHDIKLSTKESQTRKKTIENNNTKKYIYFVETASPQIDNKSQDRVNFSAKNLFSRFLQTYFSDLHKKDIHSQIEVCVRQFLLQNKEQDIEIYICLQKFFKGPVVETELFETQKLSLQTLPYYFNGFALDFIPLELPRVKIGSLKWKAACKSLQKFAEWLKRKEKTSLILICEL